MKYRITSEGSIWSDKPRFYPEFRPKWWPFWFRFDDGNGYQIQFRLASEAERFVKSAKESRNL